MSCSTSQVLHVPAAPLPCAPVVGEQLPHLSDAVLLDTVLLCPLFSPQVCRRGTAWSGSALRGASVAQVGLFRMMGALCRNIVVANAVGLMFMLGVFLASSVNSLHLLCLLWRQC